MCSEHRQGASDGSSTESEPAIEVSFKPQGRHPGLPVEAFECAELVERIPAPHRGRRQRADFHLLFVCVDGAGSHIVDFVEYPLTPGTVLRIRPGQTHEYVELNGLSMFTVIWRAEHHTEEPGRPSWFPGGLGPTRSPAYVGLRELLERELYERIRLELRRLLADETIPIGQVRRTFGFDEASNFTKYVRRIVGQTPVEFRQAFAR